MSSFQITASTGGRVDAKSTVSFSKKCQELIVKAAVLPKVRDQILVPILAYFADEAEPRLTLNSDPVKVTWEIMRQGSFMCELLNQVQPGVINEVNFPVEPIAAQHFKDINSRQNVAAFIRACKDMFFMTDEEIFNAGDLYKEDFNAFSKAVSLCEFYLNNKLRVSKRSSSMLDEAEFDEGIADLFKIDPMEVIEEEQSEEAQKKTKKREMLIEELIASERVYVEDLSKFYKYSEMIRFERLVTQKTAEAIFSNLKQLLNFQRKFLVQLESEVAKKMAMDLGKLFKEFEREFQVYETFCVNHKTSLNTLTEVMPILKKRQDLMDTIGNDVAGYLIKPVQRITRYNLFLRDLVKESNKQGFNDIESLEVASNVVKGIATRINERQREEENLVHAEEFYKHFPAGKITAEKTGRLILYDPAMKMKLGENLKTYRMYLFEKHIAMCSEREVLGPFWVKNQLSTNTVKNVEMKSSGIATEPFEVQVTCQDQEKQVQWSLLLRTDQQAHMWSSNLRSAAGLPEDKIEAAEVKKIEEEIPVVPIEAAAAEVTEEQKPAPASQHYSWIFEFKGEYYQILTDSAPTLDELKTIMRYQIELEYSFDGKNVNSIPPLNAFSLQYRLNDVFVHLQDDSILGSLVTNNSGPYYLKVNSPREIRVRAMFREVLYTFTTDTLDTLDELKLYIYETVAEDYRTLEANMDAIPATDKMRIFFKEPDGLWSLMIYDNDLEKALELGNYCIDVKL